MAGGGYGVNGGGGFGPSEMYNLLPFEGYRAVGKWVQEFIDAIGLQFDNRRDRFITPLARANLIDPSYTSVELPDPNYATATSGPTSIATLNPDSMLDVLIYIALGLYPIDSNKTIAQRQALVKIGWDLFRRKATRQQLLNAGSVLSYGPVYGWTVPPTSFGLIVPDGFSTPGWGTWVQATETIPEVIRPWGFEATYNTLQRITPAWLNFGVGFSQFRADYSGAGEIVLTAGARICLLANEHFSSWSAGLPTSWTTTTTGTGVVVTQATSATSPKPEINWEFTDNALQLDFTAALIGATGTVHQLSKINNQLTHRLEIDYSYSNPRSLGVLQGQIIDVNDDGKTYYYDPSAQTWSTVAKSFVLPASTSAVARMRYATEIIPQAASATSSTRGTGAITVNLFVLSDGTNTTQQVYSIYRIGLYENYDLATEQAAGGERTLWLPLHDALGFTNYNNSSGNLVLEWANAERNAYKIVSRVSTLSFPYHPALSGRGLKVQSAIFQNHILTPWPFMPTDWSAANCTVTALAQASPLIDEPSPQAAHIVATGPSPSIMQDTGYNVADTNYWTAGILVKKNSNDAATGGFDDFTLSIIRGLDVKSETFTVKKSDGWKRLAMAPVNFDLANAADIRVQLEWSTGYSSADIAVDASYLYAVSQNTDVLYPEIVKGDPFRDVLHVDTQGSNLLHPLLLRNQLSVTQGALNFTVVPVFGAFSQIRNFTLVDVNRGSPNRDRIRINSISGVLSLTMWDSAGNTSTASLTLVSSSSPASGQATWLRDTAIQVRARWAPNGQCWLSAGNGNAASTIPGSWTPVDTNPTGIALGSDYTNFNQFDGLIRDLEVVQIGLTV